MKHCLAFLIWLLSSAAMAANFEFLNVGSSALHITMSGQINLGDKEKLKKILMKEGRNRQIILRLNSAGGMVKPAVNIGRLVRSWGIRTVIYKHHLCFSACPMIFVAGWDKHKKVPDRVKYSEGLLGVHRPHNQKNGKIIDDLKGKKVPQLARYLKQMNAGNKMYRLIMRTSPKRARIIKDKELLRMGSYKIISNVPLPVKRFDPSMLDGISKEIMPEKFNPRLFINCLEYYKNTPVVNSVKELKLLCIERATL